MRCRAFTFVTLIGGLLPWVCRADDPRHDFEMQVRPLLAKNCYACHTQSALGGLRLDSRESILKGGKSGPALVPGKATDSLLIQAVTHKHERLKMPPTGKLSDADIEVLTAWINRGAYWPEGDKPAETTKSHYKITPEQRAFWSFQPVRKPALPTVQQADWVRNPVDAFVLAKLEKEGLHPVRQADKRALIRRATLDLTGLPPSQDDVSAFLKDDSPEAFTKVVDRLLASPQYGERWGRYWLDVARYSDDRLNSTKDDPYENSWRYRNWVIKAFNEDMPYNRFVKAQLAGDAIGEPAGLGFYALSPEMQDERVDATSRGFLGLTVACATCHDHKFDPIPTQDFYSLQNVFSNTQLHQLPLSAKDVVDAWDKQKKQLDDQENRVERFYERQRQQVAEILTAQTARYLLATRKLDSGKGLDEETLKRWQKYLAKEKLDHPFLDAWLKAPPEKAQQTAAEFQRTLIAINEEKKEIDDYNKITLGVNPDRSKIAGATLKSLERSKYILWRDLYEKSVKDAAGFFKSDDGVYYYGKGTVDRFLQGPYREFLDSQNAELARLKKELPEQYPFLQVIKDKEKLEDIHIAIRGDRNNPGDLAPRRFLAILSPEDRKPFTKGSGRAELADSIADAANPLTARVIVNRVWQHHFGRGIVATPSNFGQLGERPTHPELLDYLASTFVENGWSLKKLHREMMLSATYQLSASDDEKNAAKDPSNILLWRAERKRVEGG